jgi:DNA modification methylase
MDKPRVAHFEPKLPLSVLEEDEEYVIAEENEPKSMYESTKCFIGKRHHQTEKPQDILEFFLKYWSDEGDTILDPTMGSGSTGVACKKMGRKFIGIELTEKFFAVAENRISNAL